MADKKLTTQDILALARKQGAEGDSASSDSASEPQQDAPQAESAPAEDSTKESAPAKPSSTADILAAARAQGSGSEAKESAPAKPAAKPSSTADILAAARAKGGGAAPAKKPGSTSDILAAARAQGGGGGAAPAKKEAPAAKAKPAAVKASTGDKPALKDMVAAVKQGQAGQAPKLPAKPVPAKPKLPAKKEMTRRRFVDLLPAIAITPFAAAWAAVAAIGGLWSLGIARFMMPNMVLELPSKFKVGPASDFPPETVSEKFKASRGVWIVNTAQYNGKQLIYALLSICTHLGCTPNWLSGEQKYKCPCHGSGFYIDGINFEGPAPRPLERVGIRVAEDGSLEVDKSLKFQEELGQWGDPKSFVEVV